MLGAPMSTPAAHVVPIFATPFGVVTLPDGPMLNPALAALFSARTTAQWRDPRGGSGAWMFRSRDDLLEWPEEPVRRVTQGILAGVRAVAASISELTEDDFGALQLEARGWFTLVQPDGCVPSRSYPNTSWLAVYCVTAPEAAKTRVDSGVLRLHESRLLTMFQDPAQGGIRLPYGSGHCTWRPVPGEMAVFPAAITHEIALVRSSGMLTLVSIRARFVGSGGAWMPPW
jgi:hypothetical protein